MALTFTPIASATVGAGGTGSITFSSIPSTYTDLKILISGRTNRAGANNDSLLVQFNGSTSNFLYRNLYAGSGAGVGTVGGSSNQASYALAGPNLTANTFSNIELYITNYSAPTAKAISVDAVDEDNNTSNPIAEFRAFLWSDTAAISSIVLLPETGPLFSQYTTATLYGITKA